MSRQVWYRYSRRWWASFHQAQRAPHSPSLHSSPVRPPLTSDPTQPPPHSRYELSLKLSALVNGTFCVLAIMFCLIVYAQVITTGTALRPGMTVIRSPLHQATTLGKTIIRTPLMVQQGILNKGLSWKLNDLFSTLHFNGFLCL